MSYKYPGNFARFYDLIYHRLRDGVDNDFFIHEINMIKGRILEVGAGTGKLFTNALNHGADIYGIDISPSMIGILHEKLHPDHHKRISIQNIIDFEFGFKFDLIIAPFHMFMHLLEKKDQIRALNNIYDHLNPEGRFIFDVFVPDLNLLINGIDNQTDFDGEYEPGKTKTGRKTFPGPDYYP
ncbi:MAG TPA: class I SAM-dependent methyltransferase [Bacteroidales bacterium]|nr:class I SAM-dependent methyltransferase [Bacteroidales bacterium]